MLASLSTWREKPSTNVVWFAWAPIRLDLDQVIGQPEVTFDVSVGCLFDYFFGQKLLQQFPFWLGQFPSSTERCSAQGSDGR
jgi:hypothetical protein